LDDQNPPTIIISSPQHDTSTTTVNKQEDEGGSKSDTVPDARGPCHDTIILSPGSDRVSYEELLQEDRVVEGKEDEEDDVTTIKESVAWWRTAVDALLDTELIWEHPSDLSALQGATLFKEDDGDLYTLKVVVIGVWMLDLLSHQDSYRRFKANSFPPLGTSSTTLDVQTIIQGVQTCMSA